MLKAGERIMGYEMKGFWTDLGTPARYEGLQRRLEDREITIESLVQGCNPGEV
jgi:NDP-sugar pyrophosphorylase family protein